MILIVTLLLLLGSYLFTALVVWVASLVLPFTFSWLIALFIWLVVMVLKSIFSRS